MPETLAIACRWKTAVRPLSLTKGDFAQDEAIFLMPSAISPHPELVEGRTMLMQRHMRLPAFRGGDDEMFRLNTIKL
jgi:hypothetical protein